MNTKKKLRLMGKDHTIASISEDHMTEQDRYQHKILFEHNQNP